MSVPQCFTGHFDALGQCPAKLFGLHCRLCINQAFAFGFSLLLFSLSMNFGAD